MPSLYNIKGILLPYFVRTREGSKCESSFVPPVAKERKEEREREKREEGDWRGEVRDLSGCFVS